MHRVIMTRAVMISLSKNTSKYWRSILTIPPRATAKRRSTTRNTITIRKLTTKRGRELFGRWRKAGSSQSSNTAKTIEPMTEAFQRDVTGTARTTQKLNSIIIPRVEFRDASVREAIDFLRQQAAANDPGGEGKKGVDIVLRLAPLGQIAPPAVPVEPAQSPTGSAPGVPPEGAPPAI